MSKLHCFNSELADCILKIEKTLLLLLDNRLSIRHMQTNKLLRYYIFHF